MFPSCECLGTQIVDPEQRSNPTEHESFLVAIASSSSSSSPSPVTGNGTSRAKQEDYNFIYLRIGLKLSSGDEEDGLHCGSSVSFSTTGAPRWGGGRAKQSSPTSFVWKWAVESIKLVNALPLLFVVLRSWSSTRGVPGWFCIAWVSESSLLLPFARLNKFLKAIMRNWCNIRHFRY